MKRKKRKISELTYLWFIRDVRDLIKNGDHSDNEEIIAWADVELGELGIDTSHINKKEISAKIALPKTKQ